MVLALLDVDPGCNSVNARNNAKETPLHLASQHGHSRVTCELLKVSRGFSTIEKSVFLIDWFLLVNSDRIFRDSIKPADLAAADRKTLIDPKIF